MLLGALPSKGILFPLRPLSRSAHHRAAFHLENKAAPAFQPELLRVARRDPIARSPEEAPGSDKYRNEDGFRLFLAHSLSGSGAA
jgi:hypothetical protein